MIQTFLLGGPCASLRDGCHKQRGGFARRPSGGHSEWPRVRPAPVHLRHRATQRHFFEAIVVALPPRVRVGIWQRQDPRVVVSGLDEWTRERTKRRWPVLLEALIIMNGVVCH